MISALVLSLLLHADRTVNLTACDDVWAYAHASDGATDEYLRVWGSEGQSVAPTANEHDEFSYGFVRFDLTGLTGKVKSAKLVLTHVANPGWTLDYVKQNPVEVRLMAGDFDEKTWAYEKTPEVAATKDKENILARYSPDAMPDVDKKAVFSIDLMKDGGLSNAWAQAMRKPSPHLNLALCSSVDPSVMTTKAVYKFFSKDSKEKDVAPVLQLVMADE